MDNGSGRDGAGEIADRPPKLNVVELDNTNMAYTDIPRQLREMADKIERGEHPDLKFIVAVLAYPHAGTIVHGWGEYTIFEGIGALARGLTRLGDEG